MKKYFIPLLVFLSATSSAALEVNFDNLPQLLEKNPELRQIQQGVEQLEQRPSRLGTSFLPEVELSAGVESFDKPDIVQDTQPHYALKTSLNLYRGGVDGLKLEQQKLELQQNQAQTQSFKKQLTMDSHKALADLLQAKEAISTLKKMKSRIQEQVQRNQRNVELGQDTGTDLLHFQIKLQEVDLELGELELERQRHLELLASYLPEVDPADLSTPPGLEHDHKWAESYSFENLDKEVYLQESQLLTKEKNLEWQISKKAGLPEIDLYASWAQESQLHEEEYDQAKQRSHKVIGLNLKLPLSQFFKKSDEVQTKKSYLFRQKAFERHQQKKVETHLRAEFKRLKNLHSKLHQYEKMGKTAEKYAQKAEEEYERGVKSSADVINAYEQMAQMKMKFKKHQAQFMALLAELFI